MIQIKPLSELVQWVDVRNKGIVSENLLGINIDKCFMPSVANIIGTDLSNYKLISKNQFACNPMHVGRDEKMPIAIYSDDTPSIVSPAYFVFRVKNSDFVNPEYLMLWFRRLEFDRECWFHTDGSVRGGIAWDEIIEMTVPVPSIEEQNAIVERYKEIEKRILIKQQINDNLESQAQAIFKTISNEDIIEIPLEEFANFQEGPGIRNWQFVNKGIPFINIRCLQDGDIDINSCNQISAIEAFKTYNHFLLHSGDIIISTSGTLGKLAIVREDHLPLCLNTSIIRFTPKIHNSDYSYLLYYLKSKEFFNQLLTMATGSAQLNFGPSHIKKIRLKIPNLEVRQYFDNNVRPLIELQLKNKAEIVKLKRLNTMLLSSLSR